MMKIKVHILATHLQGCNLAATLLTFKTLRTGFPNADITVWGNGLSAYSDPIVASSARSLGCSYVASKSTNHDKWLTFLLAESPEPFWVCDTDIVFHSSVEGFADSKDHLAGRFEAPFMEPWSKTQKVSRLHTSLLWINPQMLHDLIQRWMRKWHPSGFPFLPEVEFVRQHYIPQGEGKAPLFYDTCAGLYQAIGGRSFTEEQNEAFDHLHCGTYVGRMNEAVPGLKAAHQAVYHGALEPKMMRQTQAAFYEQQRVLPT